MKIDIPVSQPYRVDIAPGLLDDLGRYVSSGTAALVVTEELSLIHILRPS